MENFRCVAHGNFTVKFVQIDLICTVKLYSVFHPAKVHIFIILGENSRYFHRKKSRSRRHVPSKAYVLQSGLSVIVIKNTWPIEL